MRATLAIGALVLAAHTARADQPAAVPPGLAVASDSAIQIGPDAIFTGPVEEAAFDDAQDLIWFTSKGTLQVIDLRDPKHTPVVILTHVPRVGFSVGGFSNASVDTMYTNAYLALGLDKKPSVDAMGAVYEVVDPAAAKKLRRQIKQAKLVGGAWIKAQLGRKAKAAPPPARPDPPALKVPDTLHCETGDCGTAFWLGTTPLEEVIVMGACGDACYRGCALYDPAKKLFAPAGSPGTWGKLTDDIKNVNCVDIVVAPAGDRYFAGSSVCTIGATMTCSDLATWKPMGWASPIAK